MKKREEESPHSRTVEANPSPLNDGRECMNKKLTYDQIVEEVAEGMVIFGQSFGESLKFVRQWHNDSLIPTISAQGKTTEDFEVDVLNEVRKMVEE